MGDIDILLKGWELELLFLKWMVLCLLLICKLEVDWILGYSLVVVIDNYWIVF